MGPKPNHAWAAQGEESGPAARVCAAPYLTRISDKFLESAQVEMKCDDRGAEILYSTDGTTPDQHARRYERPFEVTNKTTVKMRSFAAGMTPSITVARVLSPSEALTLATAPQPGLAYAYYEGIYRSVYDFAKDQPVATGVVERPTTTICQRTNWVGSSFEGLIQIPKDGDYTFYVAAKDGGQLLIDGQEQFESDCRKDAALPQQATLALRGGYHRFTLKTYKCTDAISLTTDWSGPGFERTPIPKEVLFHPSE
ncbi:hypothetical protein SBV1_1090021 [Verrucomicrobia bacterium]|nr:hypothetical protein SBV1_1090021 [Verrucomicrobiota bacterium]